MIKSRRGQLETTRDRASGNPNMMLGMLAPAALADARFESRAALIQVHTAVVSVDLEAASL
jgi:hypothetical protein